MKTPFHTLIVPLSTLALSVTLLRAETFQLTDGSIIEGTLAAPAEVVIKTAAGDQRVPFALLPPATQKLYWSESEPSLSAARTAQATGPVTDDQLEALANEVNLEAWTQVAAIGSFRDKPEKRGPGGLVVTKAFNALDENWVSVYSPKDPIGAAGNWNEAIARARLLQARTPQFMQKRWLELFLKAGEAVAQRDSAEFAATLREMKRNASTAQTAGANARNFFTAK
ncbi:MAG: hypothetical protein JWQ44_992 [Chthoniobacter sp.]|nr:hypothetical protein [Chthoniobacter sp.]